MTDPMDITLLFSCGQDLLAAWTAIGRELPIDIRKCFNRVVTAYIHRYGLEGACHRLNNRTVAAILAEYDPRDDPRPIASGEMGGLRYALFEAPDANRQDQ